MKTDHAHVILSKFTRQVNKINRLCDKISKLSKSPDQKKVRVELEKARSELIKAVIEIKSILKGLEELKRIKLPFYTRVYKKGKELSDAMMKIFVHHCEYQALIAGADQLNKIF